jgi:hypothetical protein
MCDHKSRTCIVLLVGSILCFSILGKNLYANGDQNMVGREKLISQAKEIASSKYKLDVNKYDVDVTEGVDNTTIVVFSPKAKIQVGGGTWIVFKKENGNYVFIKIARFQ